MSWANVSIHEEEVMVANKQGLHARPVTLFVQLANSFDAKIEVVKGAVVVDGKSIMAMLRLAAERGSVLRIKANGKDSADAVARLVALVKSGFGEN
jgi:phosphocarrier protein